MVQDSRQAGRWADELSISSSWMEGGTRTYERTGAASPHSGKNLYPLEKTHTLDNGHLCRALWFRIRLALAGAAKAHDV